MCLKDFKRRTASPKMHRFTIVKKKISMTSPAQYHVNNYPFGRFNHHNLLNKNRLFAFVIVTKACSIVNLKMLNYLRYML